MSLGYFSYLGGGGGETCLIINFSFMNFNFMIRQVLHQKGFLP